MQSPSRTIFGALVGLVLAALLSLDVAAYDRRLTENKVRDAYFLGTDSARSGQFLSDYVHSFQPANPGGPYVAQIEVRTPYAQVVILSRQTTGYSAQQAEGDYKQNGDTVHVRVQILYPLTQIPPVQPPAACAGAQRMNDALACFSDFSFRFAQGKPIQPEKSYGTPVYSVRDSSFVGGDVWFIFPASAITSAPLEVTIKKSGDPQASTTFNLSVLL